MATDYSKITIQDVNYHQVKEEDLYLVFGCINDASINLEQALEKFRKVVVVNNLSSSAGDEKEINGVTYPVQSAEDAFADAQGLLLENVPATDNLAEINAVLKRLGFESEEPVWFDSKQFMEYDSKYVDDEDEGVYEAIFYKGGSNDFYYFYIWE
jgi:hypothetical protein